MAEHEALCVSLDGGWRVLAGGVTRERGGRLTADVILHNGATVHQDRIAINSAEDRATFVLAAAAPGSPAPEAVTQALLELVPAALAQVQGPAEDGGGRRSQADRLVAYALDDCTSLFLDQFGRPHAMVNGQAVALTSAAYPWLRRLMLEKEERTTTDEALAAAVGTLVAKALDTGDRRELHVRSAWQDKALHVQLRPGRVVSIDASGWRIHDAHDDPDDADRVLFRQYPTARPLPDPVPVDDPLAALDSLVGLVNLGTKRSARLYTSYTATALLPHIARPILQFTGPMGSGKTTGQRLTKRVLDPTAPESIQMDRDILTKAIRAQLLLLDNAGALSKAQGDTLSRLCTGEADEKRKLYTDDDTVVVEVRRAILLNGINPPSEAADVLDRVLALDLGRIPDDRRVPERELWATMAREHGRWLGALLTLQSRALALLPSLTFPTLPRLADWGEYAGAVYAAAGWAV